MTRKQFTSAALLLLCIQTGRCAAVSSYTISSFAAVGDGKTLCTDAIQNAIDACSAAGGGTVLIPEGIYVSGPIMLKSNINLHLEAGAVLQGSRDIADYPLANQETFQDGSEHRSLLYANHATNVSITGQGTIDGQGEVWWKARAEKTLKHGRPCLIAFYACEQILLDGVKVQNSPSWTIRLLLCRNAAINGLTIQNPWNHYNNNDAIDLVSCNGVRVSNCFIDTGDDGITLKSTPSPYRKDRQDGSPAIPCENITISDCIVRHAHGGVVIGSEILGGIENVTVSNCIFDGTRCGIRMKRAKWPGGYIRNVLCNNLVMRRNEWAIQIEGNRKHDDGAPETLPPAIIENIHFSNITASGSRIAGELMGTEDAPLKNITFTDIHIASDMGFDLRHGDNIRFRNVNIRSAGPAFQVEVVKGLEIQGSWFSDLTDKQPAIQLADTRNAWIHGCMVKSGKGHLIGLAGVGNAQIRAENNVLDQGITEIGQIDAWIQWKITTAAFSGSICSLERDGVDAWLPVNAQVFQRIKDTWPAEDISAIKLIARIGSGARPEITLPEGDQRKIYIVEVWGKSEKLIICEDGELLKKIDDKDFHAF